MATTSQTRVDGGLGDEQCRAELAAVLASDGFRRSPKLSRLLTWLCEKQLSGQAAEITEYAIALEVLARGPQFNPQQDAVVRVDTHHLRKRLKEFYSGAGAERAIQIVMRNGQYAPDFAWRSPSVVAEPVAAPVAEPETKGAGGAKWIAGTVFTILLAAGAIGLFQVTSAAPPKRPAAAVGAMPGGDEVRIAAGDRSGPYIDSAGRTWSVDRFFTGGLPFHRPATILRTHDPELYQYGREGQFVYSIPLQPGVYEAHLYFAETGVISDTLRSVHIAINGQPASAVDIASDAGGINTATMKVFKDLSPGSDGFLRIMFQGVESKSFLNGIEIVPGLAGKMQTIRIVAGDGRVFRDHLGRVWLPDQWVTGGRTSTGGVPIDGTEDAPLYQWQRVGHFSYSIPVAEGGTYSVVLHFTETWFTPANSTTGVGSRVFNVYCNGTTLLKNFDILKEAGAANRALTRTFHHISASPQGKIDLAFVPVVNYALLNGIEIFHE